MKTELKRTEDLKPGDKLYLPWPADAHKPEWHRAPEVVTVKYFDGNDIILEEMGGICLRPVKDHEFKVVISEVPEAVDVIAETLLLNGFKKGTNYMYLSPVPSFKISVFNTVWENGSPIEVKDVTHLAELYRKITGRNLKKLSGQSTDNLPQLELF